MLFNHLRKDAEKAGREEAKRVLAEERAEYRKQIESLVDAVTIQSKSIGNLSKSIESQSESIKSLSESIENAIKDQSESIENLSKNLRRRRGRRQR